MALFCLKRRRACTKVNLVSTTDSLLADLPSSDVWALVDDAPVTHADAREIVGLALGHRTICADVRVGATGRLDVVIDGDASLGYQEAKRLILGALERGTGRWTTARAWAERLSARMQAGEVWV
jgi:hypothetical protein